MTNYQAGKIAFTDFGGHLILNMLEYENCSPPKKPTSKTPPEREQKRSNRVSSELPMC
ncbi:hypothetical protein [Brevibacillus choshinensis]|uniref:hypothetical protein n=1 Tax=Brevibacillus choshinensis TaxID=54911 RepID=UPI002E22540A|nr:hypothetical protein [Brevibacillus choshinensis]